MPVKKRRAASTKISREKKLTGHQNEFDYADMISGERIKGTKKGDVLDKSGNQHSVKGGKKWQVFLYGYERISQSKHLKILTPCLESFTMDAPLYFRDREFCLEYKEEYIKKHGREKARNLSNSDVKRRFKDNAYIEAKEKLSDSTQAVYEKLLEKIELTKFLREAMFNGIEVSFLAIKDDTYKKDNIYKVFEREQVLDIFSKELFPAISKAGSVPEDYNVAGQKTLLCYEREKGKSKNIVEIEIRNDSLQHYREVRFNMYSKDALTILLRNIKGESCKGLIPGVLTFGDATDRVVI